MTNTQQVNVRDLLTEANLARYQTSLDESMTEDWSSHLGREEGWRNYFSALGKKENVVASDFGVADEIEDNQVKVPREAPNVGSDVLKSIDLSLKMFTQSPSSRGNCLPLERSLMPGFNDPTYFALPALTDMETLHGDSQGISERARIAKINVQLVREAAPRKKSSMKTAYSKLQ